MRRPSKPSVTYGSLGNLSILDKDAILARWVEELEPWLGSRAKQQEALGIAWGVSQSQVSDWYLHMTKGKPISLPRADTIGGAG
jgi:hypothetical protein